MTDIPGYSKELGQNTFELSLWFCVKVLFDSFFTLCMKQKHVRIQVL